MRKYYERKYLEWGDQFTGKSLLEMKEVIDNLIKEFGKDAKLIMEYNWDSVDFNIDVIRDETEEEKEYRERQEAKAKEKDRKKFEQLKAKHGW